jgi:lipopolysaccharide export system permease protein
VRSRLVWYIAREIIVPLLVTVGLTVLVAGLSQLIKLANEVAGLPISLWDILAALPYAMPTFLGMGLPVAFLLALLIAFGRLAEDHELAAMAAAGVSTRRLLAIPLAIGAVLTLIGMYLMVVAEPIAVHKLRARLVDAAADYFARSLEPHVIHDDLPAIMIYLGDRNADTGEMRDIVLADDHDRAAPLLVTAKTGRIEQNVGTQLLFALRDGEVQIGNGGDANFRRILFGKLDYQLDTAVFARRTVGKVPMISEVSFSDLRKMVNDTKRPLPDRMRDAVVMHRKFAFPLANLLFVLAVFPITTALARPSRLRSYLGAGVIAAIFFVLAQATDTWINRLALSPALATYAPDLALLVLGSVLTWRRLRA